MIKRANTRLMIAAILVVLIGASYAWAATGEVLSYQKISSTQGGFTGLLDNSDKFGIVSSLGDIDDDGVTDMAVGASADDDGGTNRGAVWILFLNTNGTVKSYQKISDTEGGFTGILDDGDYFCVVSSIDDLDGDGVIDIAVGAIGDDDGGTDRGAVWILFLNADGTVKAHQKISDTEGGFMGALDNVDRLGEGVTSLGDLDGDGITDIAVGARFDDDGGSDYGAVWILFLNNDGTVKAHQKISKTQGGFTGVLGYSDRFGTDITSVGDLDGDGITDIAVGAPEDDDGAKNKGAVWILFLNADGTVKAHQKISNTQGGFTGALAYDDHFGRSVTYIGDLDGDSVADLAVGAPYDDDGGSRRGCVWILFLNTDGTVKAHKVISDTQGNFTGGLSNNDYLGMYISSLRDLDSDGVTDIAVGAIYDDDGGADRGAVWILFLDAVKLVGLEIVGPDEVVENFQTQYQAIAHYDNNSTADVTALADWSVEPNDNCGITAGLLTTEPIDLPENITIYAEYSEDGNTVAAEKEVEVFVIDNCLWPRVPYDPDPCDGAVGVPIDTNLVWNGGGDDCSASCSLGNGGFEEGIFGPWVAVTGIGNELTPWNVTEGWTGYFHSEPFEGRFFAQNGFDGEAGLFYDIYQEIAIPACATSAVLNWAERIQWDMVPWGATIPREYEVSVQPAGGGAPLAILYSRLLQPGTSGDTGYVAHSVDLLNGAAGIAGQTVRINFHEYIPETMTGPAQFDLDGISLSCDGDVLLGGVPTVNTSLAISQLSESSTVDFEVLKAEYDHIRSDALTALVEKSASYNFGDSSLPNSIEDDTQMTSAVSSSVISSISGQIVNGDFETGDFSGWTLMDSDTRWLGTFVINDGTYNPHSPDGPFPPYNGSFSALSDQDGPGIYSIYQDVTLPADATSAILYWVDKIRNHHNRFEDPDQEFRVERWNTNNQVLSTLFSTNPGDPLLSGWTTHSVDISDFIGMTIRIAFTEEAQRFFFNVHLDDIRIELNGGGPSYPEVYDVYFGTEDPPLELIAGDMNEPMFYPGLLDCNTMYYWQVVAKNSCGNTPGPVWSFTTISCPALVNEVIGEKLEMLERISVLLEKELVAYKGFEELLESGDYGDLDKGDIVKAKQKIHSAMQHEEQAADALEKSLEKLNDALDALDIEPNGNGL